MKKAGWVNPSKLSKGPNGRALCRLCQMEVPKGRRTFCSGMCVNEWRIRNDPNYQAKVLYERDRSLCELCGCNTDKIKAEYWEKIVKCRKAASEMMWADNPDWKKITETRRTCEEEIRKEYKTQGWNTDRIKRWWDVHHIKSISEGGGPDEWPKGQTYLDNLMTICVPCHKKETKSLRKRLKEKQDGGGKKGTS